MSTLATSRAAIAKRRSSRIALHTPIVLSGHDRQNVSFSMPATATNLNRHGAAIQLARDLSVGSKLTVRNARGTQISARVVAQLSASQGVSAYAIEFADQDETATSFWGINFPPVTNRSALTEQAGIVRRRRGAATVRDQVV